MASAEHGDDRGVKKAATGLYASSEAILLKARDAVDSQERLEALLLEASAGGESASTSRAFWKEKRHDAQERHGDGEA